MALTPDLTKFTTASPILASFNFTDIIDGTGTIVLYPFYARETSVITIMDSRINQTELKGENTTVTNTDGEKFNLDFDTKKFNLSQEINGTALIKLPLSVQPKISDQIITATITINIYKWDGTTETLIGTTTTTRLTNEGESFESTSTMIEVDLSRTTIRVNDQVRLNAIVNAQITTGSAQTADIAIGHDPENESFSYENQSTSTTTLTDTQMILNLPFDINL